MADTPIVTPVDSWDAVKWDVVKVMVDSMLMDRPASAHRLLEALAAARAAEARLHQQELDHLVRNWHLRWVDTNNALQAAEARLLALAQARDALQARWAIEAARHARQQVIPLRAADPEYAGTPYECGLMATIARTFGEGWRAACDALSATLSTPREP